MNLVGLAAYLLWMISLFVGGMLLLFFS